MARAGFPTVWSNLVGRPKGPDIEPQTIAWLRTYSNYLTPRLGVMSADTWTAVTLVLRNLILNWLVILPVLCLVVLLLKLFAVSIAWFSQFGPGPCRNWLALVATIGCIYLFAALYFSSRNRPTRAGGRGGDQAAFLRRCLVPLVLAGIFFSFALASSCGPNFVPTLPIFASSTLLSMLASGLGVGVAIFLLAWFTALPGGPMWTSVVSALAQRGDREKFLAAMPARRAWIDLAVDLGACAVAGAVFGMLMGIAAWLYVQFYDGFWFFTPGEVLLIVFGVPWTLTALLLASMIFVALSNSERDSDADREWIARADGWIMVTALGWMILMFLVFVGSTVADEIYKSYAAWGAGGVSGAITAWLGKSRFTPAKGEAKDALGISSNIILGIAAPIFAVILIVMTSAVLDEALFGEPLIQTASFSPVGRDEAWPDWPGGWSLMIAIGIACVLGAIASAVVNINRFSLHAMYRNRLIRGFLGASHADERKPDRFTDFDFSDNPRMSELWPPKEMWEETRDTGWQPFHIVNIALNVVSSKRLAWQERKAEPFTVSPLHSGSACGGRVRGDDGVWVSRGAYRPSTEYGSKNGISLGTALAISGAAASPNMGYHSSASLAFLLTLFNVRLGWWLGNPGKQGYASEGPRLAVVPLLNEMFGQTTDERKYVYLSDGGHFENLGLYEMVRRRCRLIVVSDAGCDPNFGFEDLGNAVRKISLDLGVAITLNRLEGSGHGEWTRLRTRRIAPSARSTIRRRTAALQRACWSTSSRATTGSKARPCEPTRLPTRPSRTNPPGTSFSASRSSKVIARLDSRSSTAFSSARFQAGTGRQTGTWTKSRRHWRTAEPADVSRAWSAVIVATPSPLAGEGSSIVAAVTEGVRGSLRHEPLTPSCTLQHL